MAKVIESDALGQYFEFELGKADGELRIAVNNLAAAKQAVEERQALVNMLQGKFAALKDAAARAVTLQREEAPAQPPADAPPSPPVDPTDTAGDPA